MPLIPYNPFNDLERWFEEMEPEQWFNRSILPKTPKMDIYETDKEVVAELEVPGIDPKKINIVVENNTLKIEGKEEKKEEEKKKGYYRKEIRKGSFRRIALLPAEVINDKAKAVYEEGILKINIPKSKPVKKKERKVEIKVKNK